MRGERQASISSKQLPNIISYILEFQIRALIFYKKIPATPMTISIIQKMWPYISFREKKNVWRVEEFHIDWFNHMYDIKAIISLYLSLSHSFACGYWLYQPNVWVYVVFYVLCNERGQKFFLLRRWPPPAFKSDWILA